MGFLGKGENRRRASALTPTPGQARCTAGARSLVPRAAAGQEPEPRLRGVEGDTRASQPHREPECSTATVCAGLPHTPGVPTPAGNARAPSGLFLKARSSKDPACHGKRTEFIYLFIFPFIFISWRLITLQYCSGFRHTLT